MKIITKLSEIGQSITPSNKIDVHGMTELSYKYIRGKYYACIKYVNNLCKAIPLNH